MSLINKRVNIDDVDVRIFEAIQRAGIVDAYDFIELFYISDFFMRFGIEKIKEAIDLYFMYSQLYCIPHVHTNIAKKIAAKMKVDETMFLEYLAAQNPQSTVIKFFLCDFYPRIKAICDNPTDPAVIAGLPREIMWDQYPSVVNYIREHTHKSPANLSLDIELCTRMNESMRLVHQYTGVKGLFQNPTNVLFLQKAAKFFNVDQEELRKYVLTLDRTNRTQFEKNVYNFGLRLDLFAANPSDPTNIERIAKRLGVSSEEIVEYLSGLENQSVQSQVTALEDFESLDTLMHTIESQCMLEPELQALIPCKCQNNYTLLALELRRNPPETIHALRKKIEEKRVILNLEVLNLGT